MKCFECPAKREITDPLTNPLCNAGVRPWMLKCSQAGCRYSLEQVTRWLKKKQPRTRADVLLDRWREDREAMAIATIHKSVDGGFYSLDENNHIRTRYKSLEDAIAGELAYLNSPAEDGE